MSKKSELGKTTQIQRIMREVQNKEVQRTHNLFLSGKKIVELGLVQNFQDENKQIQPAGIDFTLKRVANFESAGIIDFENIKRILPTYQEVEFNNDRVFLGYGAYLVEFNETVSLPNNIIGIMRTRSSVFRSGAILTAGVIDPGYLGAVGALLQVLNKKGICFLKNAKLVQWVFAEMDQASEKGYKGVYNNAKSMFDSGG